MFEIISHRGYWKDFSEKNQTIAFNRSFTLGFGTETDIRDSNEKLVISHDIADCSSISVQCCIDYYLQSNCKGTLVLNIKADGLQKKLKHLLEINNIRKYFVFDMSIPDTIGYINVGLSFFSRQSEYEPIPAFYEKCTGIWLDSFEGDWYGAGIIKNHLKNMKSVAIVSPELHNRDYLQFWQYLKQEKIHKMENVILCTDLPENAYSFFID